MPEETKTKAVAEKTSDEKSDAKCLNHPHRQAKKYTGNGAYDLDLCDDCAPEWFKGTEEAR